MTGIPRTTGRARHRRGALGAALLAGAVLLAGCSSDDGSAASAQDAVTIAVQGPMSGPQADIGKDMMRGARLAATDVNARGGIHGRRIVVTAADDAADPSRGRAVARRVVRREVAGVVGPFDSAVGTKSLPVYRAAGIPIVRLTSSDSTEGFGITTQPMQDQIAPVEARALTELLDASSVAILHDPSTYTAAVARQLRDLLAAAEVEVPVFRAVPPAGEGRDEVARLTGALDAVAAVRPTVTYLAMYGPQAGKTVALMQGGPGYGRCFVDLAAQGIEFTLAAGSRAGDCLASGVPPPDQLPRGAEYTARYEQTFETAPGTWGPFVHDSVIAIARAARRAGGWAHGPVRAELRRTDDRDGMTGPVRVRPRSGNRVEPPVVVLSISTDGSYRVDPAWAALVGYP